MMRISRAGGPASLPPLDPLPPIETSWALEAEREDRMLSEGELMQSDAGVERRDGNCCWTSSKRLHVGREVHARPGMGDDERTHRWVSKVSKPRLSTYERHDMCRRDDSHGEMENVEWSIRDGGFTPVSRCYPPNVKDQGAHLSHTRETRRQCSMKGKRPSGFQVDCSRINQKELECKSGDLCFSSEHSLIGHGRPSEKFSIRQNRAKRDYGGKVRIKGNRDSKESLTKYKSASKDSIKKKQYDYAATYSDTIKRCHDDAAAYNAVDTSVSQEVTCSNIKRCHDDAAAYNAVDTSVSQEVTCSNIMVPHVRVSMNIDDDDAKSDEIVTMAPGFVSPAKNIDSGNRMQRKEATKENSTRRNTQSTFASRLSPAVFVDVTNRFELHALPGEKEEVQETDAHRLSQRQRQIDYGKNTLGYERYTELVPKLKRKTRDPQTPNPKQICSKRSWDGQIRKWRRLLHVYDPPSEDGEEIAEDLSVLKLQWGCIEEDNSEAADDSSCAERNCDTLVSDPMEEKMMEDGSLTIYNDWMEP